MLKKILNKLKNFLIGLLAFALPFTEQFSRIFMFLKIDKLMALYYLFAIVLIISAILELNQKRTIRKRGLQTKATSTTILAMDPEGQAKAVVKNFKNIRKAGRNMKNYLSKLSKTQIVSIIIMVLSAVAGALVVFVPQLAQFEDTIYAIGALFLGSSFTGAFAIGKNTATSIKEDNTIQAAIKFVNSELAKAEKSLKVLDQEYATAIEDNKMRTTIGLPVPDETTAKVNEYSLKKSTIQKTIDTLKQKLDALTAKEKEDQ